MDFPGHASWSHSLAAYRALREEAGVPPVEELETPANPTASACDAVANQLAQLGLQGRRRAGNAAAGLAPRGAAREIGGSMRMTAPEALVGRDNRFQSARMSYGPEPTRDNPDPYVSQPARHSSANAAYTTHADAAPRRKSGIFSGLGKGLKKALTFGSRGRDLASSASSASFRSDSRLRLDPHSPGRELPRSVAEEAPADAEVTRHDSPPAEMPAPQEPRAVRRRRRDDERDALRRAAAASMHAEETTLPRPVQRSRIKKPHTADAALLQRAKAGLAMTNSGTGKAVVHALTTFSEWLARVGKDPMEGRLFSPELESDAQKFADLGGHSDTPAALGHLRAMELSHSGMADIATRHTEMQRVVPTDDDALIRQAFVGATGTVQVYRNAARAFSQWLAFNGHPALTAPVLDSQGQVTGRQLHSDEVTRLATVYVQSPGAKCVGDVRPALQQLRTFDLTGATNIGTRNSFFDIPEADARLIGRYRIEANKLAAAKAKAKNVPVKVNQHGTTADQYAGYTRRFSQWLQQRGKASIAAQLHDPALRVDLEEFGGGNKPHIRAALNRMQALFPAEDPGVTFGRIGHDLFVRALGTLALAPDITVGKTAERLVADVDDLLVFLDARAEDGLTAAGRELVQTFDGRALQAARGNIAQRRQMMAMAAAQLAGTSPGEALPPLEATPLGWSQVWSDAGASSHDDFSAAGSIHPGDHQGGVGFDLNELSEEAQREQSDSIYAGLDSIGSVPGYGAPEAYAHTPSEVAGPSRPAPEILGVDDYASPEAEVADFAQRLANPTAWLQGNDLWDHAREFLASFARELGRGGRARIDEMVGIGDPAALELHLLNGTARQREAVRAQLTAPTLLLPVNDPHNHWSLLVVHRDARRATHYDSAIAPERARTREARSTPQFALARRMAAALGIDAVGSMPMAQQHDEHSCGDHVLAAIETLARRIVTGQHEDLWDLSGIRPSRQHVIDTLTRAQAPELDDAVASQWVHGDRYASPDVMHALAMAGVLPTEARPQTALRIRGQRYEALLMDGNVWLHWAPARDRELSPGPAAMDRPTLLGRLGVEMGNASGQGLNCLLDSVVQLANGTRRGRRPMPELDGMVQTMRDMLANVGVVDRHGQIDVYEGANAGALLAQTFQLRLQFIQDHGDDGVFVHPVIGHEGPLLRILHTPGHFQPLWPQRR